MPGLLHDHCSAIHPMAVGSPFLTGLGLDRYGLSWRLPEIDCVHPLDGGGAGVLYRSVDATADGLGSDGSRWRALFAGPSARFDALSEDIMGPLLRLPHHPLTLARFGAPTVLPASALARWFRTDRGAGVVRRRCGTCLPAAALPDDVGDRAGDPHRRASSRLGGRGRRFAVDHQRAGSAAGRSGRQDRNRHPHRHGVATSAGRRDHVRPGARGGRRHPRRPSAGPNRHALTGGSAAARARSRSTSPSKAASRGPIPKPAAPGPCMSSARSPNWPPPNATSTPGACRSDRSSWSVSSIWPTRSDRSATSTRCGPTRTSPTATPATPPRRSSPRSSGSRPASATASSGTPCASTTQMASYNPNFVGGDIMTGSKDIRQLTFGPRITLSPYSVGAARHVHLLGGHPARSRRARHVRIQRRPDRTRRTQPLNSTTNPT